MDLKAQKQIVKSRLAGIPGFRGVGIGDTVKVYVADQKTADVVRDLVRDIPVTIIVEGQIRVQAP